MTPSSVVPNVTCCPDNNERGADGIAIQEFSIEIPDKDADTIHSGTLVPVDLTVIYRGTNMVTRHS